MSDTIARPVIVNELIAGQHIELCTGPATWTPCRFMGMRCGVAIWRATDGHVYTGGHVDKLRFPNTRSA